MDASIAFGAMHPALSVDVDGVTKTYGDLVAVDDVSVEVAQGEVYGILGPNGAGKTTFMRMLFGLIRPDGGEIRLFGRTWAKDGTRSEEHTSELQSLRHLVCRLLLEKKKRQKNTT